MECKHCCFSWIPKKLLALWSKIFGFIREIPVVGGIFDIISIMLLGAFQGFYGSHIAPGAEDSRRPNEPIILYDYEGCPNCAYVRRTLSTLALDYICYPCPRETLTAPGINRNSRYRPELLERGKLIQLPFIIDSNTNMQMYESADIVSYLWRTYGDKAKKPRAASLLENTTFRKLICLVTRILRPCPDMGVLRIPSRKPEKMLELWGFEGSPFTTLVREKLACLEISHLFHSLPIHETIKRAQFRKIHQHQLGSFRNWMGYAKFPYIEDPNTETALFESRDIIKYLEKTYQTGNIPDETWEDWNSAVTANKGKRD